MHLVSMRQLVCMLELGDIAVFTCIRAEVQIANRIQSEICKVMAMRKARLVIDAGYQELAAMKRKPQSRLVALGRTGDQRLVFVRHAIFYHPACSGDVFSDMTRRSAGAVRLEGSAGFVQ